MGAGGAQWQRGAPAAAIGRRLRHEQQASLPWLAMCGAQALASRPLRPAPRMCCTMHASFPPLMAPFCAVRWVPCTPLPSTSLRNPLPAALLPRPFRTPCTERAHPAHPRPPPGGVCRVPARPAGGPHRTRVRALRRGGSAGRGGGGAASSSTGAGEQQHWAGEEQRRGRVGLQRSWAAPVCKRRAAVTGGRFVFGPPPRQQPAMDTLPLWASHPFKPEIRGGRFWGRGASDDKGSGVLPPVQVPQGGGLQRGGAAAGRAVGCKRAAGVCACLPCLHSMHVATSYASPALALPCCQSPFHFMPHARRRWRRS